MVYKEQVPSCINWCAHAKECLGEERWKQLTGDEETTTKIQKKRAKSQDAMSK